MALLVSSRVFKFSIRFWTFLCKFMPKYFISFLAVISAVFSSTTLSDWFLFIYMTTIDFCVDFIT